LDNYRCTQGGTGGKGRVNIGPQKHLLIEMQKKRNRGTHLAIFPESLDTPPPLLGILAIFELPPPLDFQPVDIQEMD